MICVKCSSKNQSNLLFRVPVCLHLVPPNLNPSVWSIWPFESTWHGSEQKQKTLWCNMLCNYAHMIMCLLLVSVDNFPFQFPFVLSYEEAIHVSEEVSDENDISSQARRQRRVFRVGLHVCWFNWKTHHPLDRVPLKYLGLIISCHFVCFSCICFLLWHTPLDWSWCLAWQMKRCKWYNQTQQAMARHLLHYLILESFPIHYYLTSRYHFFFLILWLS